ncbi:MAG: hypothetical protein ACYC09_04545, partial [Bacteroidota bacterium]
RNTLKSFNDLDSIDIKFREILMQRVPNNRSQGQAFSALSNLLQGMAILEEERHPILDRLDKYESAVVYWCNQFNKELNSK